MIGSNLLSSTQVAYSATGGEKTIHYGEMTWSGAGTGFRFRRSMLGLLGVLHGHLALGGVYVSDFEDFFHLLLLMFSH